jgi:hypothetical protein
VDDPIRENPAASLQGLYFIRGRRTTDKVKVQEAKAAQEVEAKVFTPAWRRAWFSLYRV